MWSTSSRGASLQVVGSEVSQGGCGLVCVCLYESMQTQLYFDVFRTVNRIIGILFCLQAQVT